MRLLRIGAIGLLVAAAVAITATSMPDIMRYLKMRSM